MNEPIEDFYVLKAMTRYGGGFVQALAEAARRADDVNIAKIKAAFPEYWEKYSKFALTLKQQDKQS